MLSAFPVLGKRSFGTHSAFVAFLAVTYMGISTGLLTFNKYLMREDRFPFAMFIGLLHMTCAFSLNGILYWVCPSLFPSLTDPEQRVDIDRLFICRVLFPIASCFAGQIVLNNLAFQHSSVAFLQMMKESNVVLVYVISLILALEVFDCKRAGVLLFILGATALTIHGEDQLSYTGLTIQGTSLLCESTKLALQSYSLSATGKRLDALTYVIVVAPLVFLVLAVSTMFMSAFWPSRPISLGLPSWEILVEYRMLLLANGSLAFAMNVSHALFIKNSSAITFILAGIILKDILIVVAGSMIMRTPLSTQQAIGFTLQLLGILVWSRMKMLANEPANAMPATVAAGGWEALRTGDQDSLFEQAYMKDLSRDSSSSTMAPMDDEETPQSPEQSNCSRSSYQLTFRPL